MAKVKEVANENGLCKKCKCGARRTERSLLGLILLISPYKAKLAWPLEMCTSFQVPILFSVSQMANEH